MKSYEDALVSLPPLGENGLPEHGNPFVEAELLPHFEAFLSAQGSSFNKPMYSAVCKAILVTLVVKPCFKPSG